MPAAVATLEDLRALGVRIAIDDFGTGQSSLSRLRDIPADIVKIDRNFPREATSGKGGAVLSALMAMAEAVGLAVVAEGVETGAQRNRLLGLGCGIGQGYLFQRPGSAAAVGAVFASGGRSLVVANAPGA